MFVGFDTAAGVTYIRAASIIAVTGGTSSCRVPFGSGSVARPLPPGFGSFRKPQPTPPTDQRPIETIPGSFIHYVAGDKLQSIFTNIPPEEAINLVAEASK